MSLLLQKEWTTAASQVPRMTCENIMPNNYFCKSTTASLSRLEDSPSDYKQWKKETNTALALFLWKLGRH